MSLVMYQVERRPIAPSGKVYRGTGIGDFITVLSHPENLLTAPGMPYPNTPQPISSTTESQWVPAGGQIPPLGTTGAAKSHVVEVSGEPWLVHSTHFSVESAVDSAAPLASAIGAENVRIVKVITGSFEFKLK